MMGLSLMIVHACVLAVGILMILRKIDLKFFWPTLICCIISNFVIFNSTTDSEKKENVKVEQNVKSPEQIKEDNIKKLSEKAYLDGVDDARSSGSVEEVQDLIRAGYGKENIRGMQKTQGRLNYKEEYGEPKTSEEKELQELYGEKYAEGFIKTMFKD